MIIGKDMDVSSSTRNMKSSEFSLVDTKIFGLVGMAVSTILFGILPLLFVSKLRNNNDPASKNRLFCLHTKYKETKLRWRTMVSLLSCFSGGVFMGACFLDLIPDVDEIFQQVFRFNCMFETLFLVSFNC